MDIWFLFTSATNDFTNFSKRYGNLSMTSLLLTHTGTYFFWKCCQILKDDEISILLLYQLNLFILTIFKVKRLTIHTFQKGKQNGELRTEFRKGHNKYRRCCGPLCWTFMIFKTLIGEFLDYRIASYSCRGNYSFLNSQKLENFIYRISSYSCRGNYSFLNSSSEESIQVFVSLM